MDAQADRDVFIQRVTNLVLTRLLDDFKANTDRIKARLGEADMNIDTFQREYSAVLAFQMSRLLGEFYDDMANSKGMLGTLWPFIQMQLRRMK